MNKTEQFFYDHAGYSYGPDQTPEEGRRECAARLAKSAAAACDGGLEFNWEVDPDVKSDDWMSKEELNGRDPWVTWWCGAYLDGELVASLGGIDFGEGVEPWGQPYKRVIEAELAQEAGF